MRLTALTDYALRLLMHVAQHPERLCTIKAWTLPIVSPSRLSIFNVPETVD